MKNLVLIPGLDFGESLWTHVKTNLADVAECHVFPVAFENIDEMVKHVLKHVDGPFSIASHSSVGAVPAVAIAAAAPERVSHLMLFGASVDHNPDLVGFFK